MILKITRDVPLPDPVALERFKRCPDLGPRILFFSGGTALRRSSFEMIRYSHNTIHIITPFDSGGSSAVLRKAFGMPAVGDIRNRLLALADKSLHGNPQIFRLFSLRMDKDGHPSALRDQLGAMIAGRHPLVKDIPDPMRKIIRRYLRVFAENAPDDFDLRKASIGNLILTGGYFEADRHLDPVIFIFSKLVQVRGVVRPVINADLHLAADLESGETLVGQHLLTGKEGPAISSKVSRIFLSSRRRAPAPVRPPIRNKMRKLIAGADLICFPMGSFYSSVVANLLPAGAGRAAADAPCLKIFIPNTAPDPETFGMDVADQTACLLRHLKQDDPGLRARDVLNYALLDVNDAHYPGGVDAARIENMGVRVLRHPLVGPETRPLIDEKRLMPVLFSLA